mmetsp:Transcript_15908/g.47856  ORF Transcript_15908/g.47856 Transcript_15908/m.47856 type:complete len:259 (-) Transcript_15908:65-841(-)
MQLRHLPGLPQRRNRSGGGRRRCLAEAGAGGLLEAAPGLRAAALASSAGARQRPAQHGHHQVEQVHAGQAGRRRAPPDLHGVPGGARHGHRPPAPRLLARVLGAAREGRVLHSVEHGMPLAEGDDTGGHEVVRRPSRVDPRPGLEQGARARAAEGGHPGAASAALRRHVGSSRAGGRSTRRHLAQLVVDPWVHGGGSLARVGLPRPLAPLCVGSGHPRQDLPVAGVTAASPPCAREGAALPRAPAVSAPSLAQGGSLS